MSQYVSGKTVPRADIAHFLAAFLQVNEDWLMGEDVPMEQNAVILPAIESDETQPDSNSASAQSTEGKTMRTFTKSHKLDNVLYDVRGPVADEAARMEAAGTHILKLNIGNPAPFGFRTPDEVVYDMAQQLPETEGYSPSKGLFSARKAIMQYAQLKNIPNVSIDDIFTGNGVSELINLSLSALLDNGDEVLVPSPDYPLWTACVNLAGGTAVVPAARRMMISAPVRVVSMAPVARVAPEAPGLRGAVDSAALEWAAEVLAAWAVDARAAASVPVAAARSTPVVAASMAAAVDADVK